MGSAKKNFIWNSIGSTLYALTSLAFLIIATRVNGVEQAGMFTFAFANACVLQVIGIYAGRSYQVTERNKKITDGDYVYNRLLTTITMMVIGVVMGAVTQSWGIQLGLVTMLLIYKALDAFAEALYGILQKQEKLYQVGISLTLKAVTGVVLFLTVDLWTRDLLLSSLLLAIINLVIMGFYDFRKVRKMGFEWSKIDWQNNFEILKFGFPAFLITLLTQYLLNASRYAIENMGDMNMQTIYGIILMPATVMILVSSFIVHPYLNKIKKFLEEGKLKKLNKLAMRVIFVVVIIGVAGAMLGYLLGVPIFQIMYGVNIGDYIWSLVIIILGATWYGVVYVLSNILIAMRRIMVQTIIFGVITLSVVITATLVVGAWGIWGAALLYMISMLVLMLLYFIYYIWCMKKEKDEK